MVTTIYERPLAYVLLTAWIVVNTSSLEVPTYLQEKNWQLKSDEGEGSVYFYSNRIVLLPRIFVGGVEISTWDLVATKTNFMAFRSVIASDFMRVVQRSPKSRAFTNVLPVSGSPDTVSINSEDKYIYKCWMYKQQNESLFYYFPMTGILDGQRVHASIDGNLDICDFCTDTGNKLYTLHQNTLSCGCTPLCSELTIQNTCTGTNHDTSSTNCLSESSTSVSTSTTNEETSTQQSSETLSLITSPTTETSALITSYTTETSASITSPTTATSALITSPTTVTSASITSPASVNDLSTSVTVATTAEFVENSEGITTEKAQETTITEKKDISASEKLGMDPDDLLGVVSGSIMFIYLAAAMFGCGCCYIILGRRRKKKKKDKESQESLVPEKMMFQNNCNILSGLPSVFYRIDE